jgi:transposase
MYPNSNYYELYNLDPELSDIDVWDYGYSYLVLKICRESGLLECLTKAFGIRAMDIIVMAAYIIREGGSMDGIDDWQQRNYFLGYKRLLTSQTTSKIFADLTMGKRNAFFKDWVQSAKGSGAVCYDVTSISSYAQQMPTIERGYNRDGENLAQFNLGLFCDEESKAPLYYNRYNGSLTDKTNLSYVLDNARDIGIERIKMVIDGGLWDEDCFASLSELCDNFIVGMPAYLKEAKDILLAHAANIQTYENKLDFAHIYRVPAATEIWGVEGNILLYFDALSHAQLCESLMETINRLKAELASLKRYPKSKLARYKPYFKITEKPGGFDYTVDSEEVDNLIRYKGFFLLFSTDKEETPDDTLQLYRDKDAVEKLFDQIKCDMDGNRIRTHNEHTTDGKTFVTFIACIIRSHLHQKLRQYLIDNSTSLKKVLSQLSNITVVSGSKGIRFTKALTKKQKEILKPFNAHKDILSSFECLCMR